MSATQQFQLDGSTADEGPILERTWAMPNKWTFDVPPIREFVEEGIDESDGLWIDPFSGESHFADVSNDLNPRKDADYSLKAREFLAEFDDNVVDGGVILDPPYSPRQVKECYNNVGLEPNQYETGSGWIADIRDEITRVCADDAVVLSFGWGSNGIGKTRGFRKKKVLLVCHGGWHNDTICVRERFIGEQQ